MRNKIIERIYFLFLVSLPLIFCPGLFDALLIPRQIYLTLFVGLIGLLLWHKRKSKLQLPFTNTISFAICFYFIFAFLSFYHSMVISESHYIVSRQLILFAFFFLTAILLSNNMLRFDQLIKSCMAFGIMAIATGALQIVEKTIRGQNLFHQVDFIAGGFGNKNLLSSVLFLCLPFFLLGLNATRNFRLLAATGFISALSIIVIIRTRIVVIAAVFYLLFLLYHYLVINLRIRKRRILSFALLFFAGLTLVYKLVLEKIVLNLASSPHAPTQYFYRLFDSQTYKTRTLFWQNSMAMFKEHPFGVGLGNWQVHFPKYGLDKFADALIINGEKTLQRPHNDFIWILCESGILGLLAYLSIFAIILYQLYYLIKKAATTIEKWKFIYVSGAVIGYLIISFFDFPLERIEHQVLLLLLFAIAVSSYNKIHITAIKHNKSHIIIMFVVLAFLYSIIVSGFRLKGEMETAKMKVAIENKQWNETILRADFATSYFYQMDATSIPIEWYQGLAYFHQNEIAKSQPCFEKAYSQAPYQLQVINSLASCYEKQGKRQAAIDLYSKALQISSGFEESRLNLAAVYYNSGDFQKAFQTIDKININSKNSRYKAFLLPILSKEINRILSSNSDQLLSQRFAKNIDTAEKLEHLYFESKKNNTTFVDYILNPKINTQ